MTWKCLPVVVGALLLEQVEQQRDRFFLDVAPRVEIDAEAVELVFAVAGAQAQHEAPAAQDVDKGRVLGHPHRIGERQRHHRGADLDPLGQCREIAGIDEHIRHDAVFVREVMLGEPRIVEAKLVGAHDLARHARMHVAPRVGLDILVGVGGEQDSEFHLRSFPG